MSARGGPHSPPTSLVFSAGSQKMQRRCFLVILVIFIYTLAPWQRNASLTGISVLRPSPIHFRPFPYPSPQFQCKKGPRNPRQAFFLFSSYSRMLYICFAFFFIFILTLGTNILHYVPSCDNTYKILLVVNNRYKILSHSLVQQIFHVGIHTDRRIVGPALE